MELAPGAVVVHVPGWLPGAEERALRAHLEGAVGWTAHRLGGRADGAPLPRLTAWVGDLGAAYRYSGITNVPAPWTPEIEAMRGRVDEAVRAEVMGFAGFNGCLLNRYRSGADSVAWHRDDESALGDLERVVVASVSLGGTRRFLVRPCQVRGAHPLGARGAEREARRRADLAQFPTDRVKVDDRSPVGHWTSHHRPSSR